MSSMQHIAVPLTEAERRQLLELEPPQRNRRRRKLGSVEPMNRTRKLGSVRARNSNKRLDSTSLDPGSTGLDPAGHYRELPDGRIVQERDPTILDWWRYKSPFADYARWLSPLLSSSSSPQQANSPPIGPTIRTVVHDPSTATAPLQLPPMAPSPSPTPPPQAPSGVRGFWNQVVQATQENPLALGLLAGAPVVGAGLGYVGVRSLMDASRRRRQIAARNRAKREFAEALLAEREQAKTSALNSAIDDFISACEEKELVKEADMINPAWNTFLGLMLLAGGGSGLLGLYNGLKSEPADLRRIRALRQARQQHLALQEEFEPHVDMDTIDIPSRPVRQIGMER